MTGETVLTGLSWRLVGPHRGGRVLSVSGVRQDPSVFYFGACAGGVWKSNDAGTTWRNVSDGFFATAAVGALAVAPSDPNVIYVGTGEATIRGDVSHGDGVYKSEDAGRTWRNVGLRDTRHIGRIVVHPSDPDTVYVAAFGHAWGPSSERGVFRTRDGGCTWQKVLFRSDRAGSHDIAMDAHNPRILYAAVWQAQRHPHALVSGGPECGLWRSTDGGDTWEDITRSPGLPQGMLGKIGVAASPAQSGRVWALVEAEDGAMFRSDDFGASWMRLSAQSLLRTRPWYYMHVTPDPTDPDTLYVQNYGIWKSIDAGRTFERMTSPHGDEHALWIDPADPRRMVKGDDGGCSVSVNGGRSWTTQLNQPTAQIYHVTTDSRVPYRIYGSQQDNTAMSLPSLAVDGAIHERDWYAPGGGESGYIAVKPDDPDIVVASGPNGRRAFNDVMTLYDHRTGQKRNITVWPELYGWGVGAQALRYRFQWTFPILFSQHDPDALYVAGNRVFRSRDLGTSWEAVSPDLTRNDPSRLGPSGGPVTRDNTGAEVYCTIFALAESPVRAGLFWAGSDDGLVHVTEDGGATWRDVTPPTDLLPEWALISIVEPSPHDAHTAYVAATRYKLDDTRPYILKTTDLGQTWSLVVDGLPADDFTRVVREDPRRPGLLYAGTETSVYALLGGRWQRLAGNLPVVPIHDLIVKDDDLIVATHGRSFWVLDDLNPVRETADGDLGGPVHLFAPKAVMRVRTYGGPPAAPTPGAVNYWKVNTSTAAAWADRLPSGETALETVDAGMNPPDGVIVQYALSAPVDGVEIAFLDEQGAALRTYALGPMPAGPHRFVWNLRLAGTEAVQAPDLEPWHRPDGPLVLPGRYRVELRAQGVRSERAFEVLSDPRVAATRADLEAQFAFLCEIRDGISAVNRTLNAVDGQRGRLHAALARPEGASPTGEGERTHAELEAIRAALIDVNMRQSQLWPSGLHEKLNALFDTVDSADYVPPAQTREVFAILMGQLADLQARFEAAVSAPSGPAARTS